MTTPAPLPGSARFCTADPAENYPTSVDATAFFRQQIDPDKYTVTNWTVSRPNPRRPIHGAICSNRHEPTVFVPLPFFGWPERPLSLPLDVEECATALYLAPGDVGASAALLKVSPARLNRVVRTSPRLMRLKAVLLPPAE